MSSWPAVNWDLLSRLAGKTHPHLNITEGAVYVQVLDGVQDDCCGGIGEVLQEARTVQHLCDMAGVPQGLGYDAHIDARVYLLLAEVLRLRDRMARLVDWHSREAGPAGTVGDFCVECGERWPCDTRRMASGTYEQEEEARSGA